jgi:hypothetical protein
VAGIVEQGQHRTRRFGELHGFQQPHVSVDINFSFDSLQHDFLNSFRGYFTEFRSQCAAESFGAQFPIVKSGVPPGR